MKTKLKLASAAVIALVVAGCGAAGQMASRSNAYELATPGAEASAMGHQGRGHGFGFGMFGKQLGLTDAQKAQMKAIALKYRPAAKPDFKAQQAQLKALLSASTVDGPALKAFLLARQDELMGKADTRVAMMGEMRGVLTDAQRAQLVTQLNAPAKEHKARFEGLKTQIRDRLLGDMNLTADQKAKLDALQAKMESLRTSGAGQAHKAAFARFVQDGDQAALKASMANAGAMMPVDEVVAVATSLDKTQRDKLIAKFEAFAKLRGGHGRGHGHYGAKS
jgi:Spy/CpxP family protein refolding chaperone